MIRRLQITLAVALVSGQAHAAKIPQLDTTWFASQLFWLALCFTTLIVVVRLQIHPKVRGVLAARDEAIQGALKEAESYKASAEAAKNNFEQAGSDARSKAASLIADAQVGINVQAADEQAKLDDVLNKKLAEAEKSTKHATQEALSAIAQPTAGLVQTMAGTLLGKDVSQSDAESAVKKVA